MRCAHCSCDGPPVVSGPYTHPLFKTPYVEWGCRECGTRFNVEFVRDDDVKLPKAA